MTIKEENDAQGVKNTKKSVIFEVAEDGIEAKGLQVGVLVVKTRTEEKCQKMTQDEKEKGRKAMKVTGETVRPAWQTPRIIDYATLRKLNFAASELSLVWLKINLNNYLHNRGIAVLYAKLPFHRKISRNGGPLTTTMKLGLFVAFFAANATRFWEWQKIMKIF